MNHPSRRAWARGVRRALGAILLLPVAAALGAELHVAPGGSDAAAGTAIAPVATLRRAVELARERWPGRGATIWVHGGVYRLDRTLVLGPADSRSPADPLTIAAEPGEHVVISGGEPIRNWRRLPATEEPPGVTAAAHGHLWAADLPARGAAPWRFHVLYDGMTLLPRARSPEYTTRSARVPFARRMERRDVLDFPAGSVTPWPNLRDVEIFCRPNHDWLVNYLGLASVDAAHLTARTTVPATYGINGPFWVENTIESLDEPGEWVLDSAARRVYLWPRGAAPGNDLVAPVLSTLVRVAGREDPEGSADVPVRGIRFVGLTFAQTERAVWAATDAGVQHDWAMADKDDACLRFRVATDCEVSGCTFEAAGGFGVRGDLLAQRIAIHDCRFRDLGAGGVLFCGYGPGTKDVNHDNRVTEDEFCRLGQLWWDAPAVMLWQSGTNLVAHNLIHDLPYNGIVIDGVRPRFFGIDTPEVGHPSFPPGLRENLRLMRWNEIGIVRNAADVVRFAHSRGNVIRDNEIHDVMLRLHDGNAIYLSAAGPGNVVHRNVVYRMGDSAAIRTDDDQSGTSITENVLIGSGLVIKDANDAWNNVLIDGTLRVISNHPECRLERNVFYFTHPTTEFCRYDVKNGYYFADILAAGGHVTPPRADRNLYFAPDQAAAEALVEGMRKTWGADRASVVADPRFRDAAHGDFRFADGSPALALGIQSIDLAGVGLSRDPCKHRLSQQPWR
ncbi:MAG TPA: right-handed parallel beta-helix repeat-containing protein [Opitutaceae bacterium]|nr:right-handed parallel beta-helix repeat-containing protein [Opitutaceae bacterium]